MKCFFSFRESNDRNFNYVQLLKVSVYSARQNTDLDLFCLFDGTPGPTTEWLSQQGVTVIHHRSFLYDQLQAISRTMGDPNVLDVGGGAFLRVEIPSLLRDLGHADPYVLYTDCDVLFQRNVVPALKDIRPRYFAVAPEHDPADYGRMNSGVMLMNTEALLKKDPAFRQFLQTQLPSLIPNFQKPLLPSATLNTLLNRYFLVSPTWDQSAYQRFYGQKWLGRHTWDHLPLNMNWKPYWGNSQQADIIHFHGPKPNQLALLTAPDLPPHLRPLLPMATPDYIQSSEVWQAMWQQTS